MDEWREELGKRRRSSKTRRLFVGEEPTNKYSLDATVGPMHYEDAQGDLQDINAELVPSTRSIVGFGNPAYEMIENEYEMFVLGTLNSGVPLVRYVSKNTDYWVQFAAHNLQWTNDLDQVDFIATPSTTPTGVSGSEAKWPDAYGAGLGLRYIAGMGRMGKWLDIDSPLPSPPQYIIDGGNPVIEFAEILEFHGGLDVYVSGAKWNKKDDVSTATEIEFRSPDGEVQFVFPVATGLDESEEGASVLGQLHLKKQGGKLYVTARFPWPWLQSAVYPVHLDTTVDEQVGAGEDDAEQSNGSCSATSGNGTCGSLAGEEWCDGNRFLAVVIASGATIDVAYLTYLPAANDSDAVNYSIYGEDSATPAAFATAGNDITDRTRTTAFASENSPANWSTDVWVNSASIVSVIQELADTYDYSSGLNIVLMRIYVSGSGERYAYAYEGDSAKAAKLHIEYTAAAAGVPQQMMHYMRMRKE